MSSNEFLSVEPMRHNKRSTDGLENQHVVRRMSWNPSWLLAAENGKRARRNANAVRGQSITIETAVFVDAFLYNHMARTNFPDDTEFELTHFVLAMINAVISRVYCHHPESLSVIIIQ